ncbi:MAG: glycosyltransferase [Oscillospiraceae bacterium]|nr:glycosyltransferase [Oscillospiraceae bacterium]
MNEKIRLAHITKNMVINGISNVIMNYSVNLDKNMFDITIIAGNPIHETYKDVCSKNGITIVELPEKVDDTKRYYKKLFQTLHNGKFDIVHVHGNSATISVELLLAKMAGCHNRIAHSHNSTCDNLRVHKLLYPFFRKLYTVGLACSKKAGDWLFRSDEYQVLQNAFDTRKFAYESDKRDALRNNMGIGDDFTILCVGRVNEQKNYPYLLKIFEAVAAEKKDAQLILVGDGPELSKVLDIVDRHPYKERIIYYGTTDHVEELYSLADVFVLPSKFEGLGIVFIEAQISGLPVITSDQVPLEGNISNRVQFLALSEQVDEWKKAVLHATSVDRKNFYSMHQNEIEQYDIRKNAKILSDLYISLLR